MKNWTLHNDNSVTIFSRGKKAWLAKLGGKSSKYGREREFVNLTQERSGMSKQKVAYNSDALEPGDYELAGNEFGDFRDKFTV